jgi:phosphoserine phosphatase
MDLVLSVIADPATRPLGPDHARRAREALADSGAGAGDPDWLAVGAAFEIPFAGLAAEAARGAARDAFADLPVDLAALPAEGRRKALLLADMESTIIAQELLDELAERVGQREAIAAITARAMAGELDFEAGLRARLERLAGLSAADLDATAGRITLNPGARALVRTLRANGVHTALVTGGFTCFTAPVAAACGFHEVRANRLLLEDGRMTGGVAEPILGPDAKREALEEIAAAQGLAPAEVCAVGDGSNDAAMLAAAGLGVGYRPKPPARAAADVTIDHGDLTTVLYFQGYRETQILNEAK